MANNEEIKQGIEQDISVLLNRLYIKTGMKPTALRFKSNVDGLGHLACSVVIECAPAAEGSVPK